RRLQGRARAGERGRSGTQPTGRWRNGVLGQRMVASSDPPRRRGKVSTVHARTHRTRPVVTLHAAQRWAELVDSTVSLTQARIMIADFLAYATLRPRPRRWMDGIALIAGTTYGYSARYPDVCLLIAAGTVRTVITRPCHRGEPRRDPSHGYPSRSTKKPA